MAELSLLKFLFLQNYTIFSEFPLIAFSAIFPADCTPSAISLQEKLHQWPNRQFFIQGTVDHRSTVPWIENCRLGHWCNFSRRLIADGVQSAEKMAENAKEIQKMLHSSVETRTLVVIVQSWNHRVMCENRLKRNLKT